MDPTTRRFVSIVVVAMLLLVVLLSALTMLPAPEGDGDGDGEDPGWEFQDEGWDRWIYVYDNATWSGWDQVMPYPVYVDNGVTLTIERSHLRVPLETMVFKEMPSFHVEPFAQLVLRNSTVEVEADQRLATAMLDTYPYDDSPPVLWRVVNLREAFEPVLEVDVEFMMGRSYLVVAAQMTPEEPLEPLEVLEPDEVELFEWTTLQVPLDDYTGGTPRVAVFVHNSSSRDVLISGLRITDRGSPVSGDVPPAGDLRTGGWTEQHLSGFLNTVPYGEFDLEDLIFCLGDLRVEDSRLLSLPGLEREVRQYRPNGRGTEVTAWKVPEQGCVNVTGDLTMLSSEVAYAPIKWTGDAARLEGCSFYGDCDLVTLAGWDAEVRDCAFSFETPEGLWRSGLRDTETWMLALEHLANQAPVEGCTFSGEGEGIGLVVNGASVVVDDCSFSDLALGVWDHQSMVPLRWDGGDATVTFDPSCDLYYIETREVHVELNGPGEPDPWDTSYSHWSPEYIEEVPGLEGLYMMEEVNDHYSIFTLPATVVRPHTGREDLHGVRVNIRPSWMDQVEEHMLDPYEDGYTIWLKEPEDPPDHEEHYLFWDWSLDVGDEDGTLRIRLGLSVEMEYFSEPYLNISVDGELVDRVDVEDAQVNMTDSMGYLVIDQTIPPGAHNITVTAGATYTELDWIIEMDQLTAWVYRTSEGGMADEAMEWLENRTLGALMVDGGNRLEGLSYEGNETIQNQMFFLLTWEGTEVVIEGWNGSSFWGLLALVGNGTVEMRDLDIYAGTLRVKNVTATIDGLTSLGYLRFSLYDADVRLRGTVEVLELYLNAWNGSTLEARGADFDLWSQVRCLFLGGRCILVDCMFQNRFSAELRLGTVGGGGLSVEGCHFMNVPLLVDLYDVNDTVNITGSSFEGRRGRLAVLPSDWGVESNPGMQVPFNGTVSGNFLAGNGTDLVVHRLVRDRLLGENRISGGARAYVLFDPEVVIQGGGWWDHYNLTTGDAFVFQRAGYVPYYLYRNKLNLLVDVTDDPLDTTDPGPVTVVVRLEESSRRPSGGVEGFARVYLTSPTVTVQVIDWDDMQEEIRLLEKGFNIEDNWWTT